MKEKTIQNILADNAVKEDVTFILRGIKEICKIEKQKPDPDKTIIKLTNNAINNNQIRILRINKKPIGFVQYKFTRKSLYGFDYGPYKRKYCWIDWWYVTKAYRRKGIGNMLYKEMIKICKKQKIKEIILDVFDVNRNARRFYEKEKFHNSIHILKEKIS